MKFWKINIGKICMIVLFLFAFINTIRGQWYQTNGPFNSEYTALISDSLNLYAGTKGGGVFRSIDFGESWTSVNTGLINKNITTLTLVDTKIFAGTNGGGVFFSSNNGEYWEAFNNGLTNTEITCFLSNDTNLFVGTQDGIFSTTDNKTNWTPINNGLTSKFIYSLEKVDSNLFAGTYLGGVFLSTNNGISWKAINNGLTSNTIRSLFSSGSNLLAGTLDQGLFLSNNYGTSWIKVDQNARVNCFAMKDNTILAAANGAIFYSTDDGLNWNQYNLDFFSKPWVSAINIINSKILAAGNGLLRSDDNGTTWLKINDGLSPGAINSISISPSHTIYACSSGALFMSNDDGSTWIKTDSGLEFMWFNNVRFHPNGSIFACTFPMIGAPLSVVFKSDDNGMTWSPSRNGFTYSQNNIYDVAFNSNGDIFAATNDGIYKSINNGDLWLKSSSGLNTNIITSILVDQNDNVFAGTYDQGMYISNSNGNTWSQINNGLTTNDIKILAKNSSNHIFVGSDFDGIYRSTDNGTNWNNILYFPPWFQTWGLTIDSKGGIFTGVVGGQNNKKGVWYSSDNGDTWIQDNAGLPTYPDIYSLGIVNNYIFAASLYGVWKRPLTDYDFTKLEIISKDDKVKIFPNPATDKINLVNMSFKEEQLVSIYDIKGNLIFQKELQQPEFIIETNNFTAGIYFVQIFSSDINIIKKIIIMK